MIELPVDALHGFEGGPEDWWGERAILGAGGLHPPLQRAKKDAGEQKRSREEWNGLRNRKGE